MSLTNEMTMKLFFKIVLKSAILLVPLFVVSGFRPEIAYADICLPPDFTVCTPPGPPPLSISCSVSPVSFQQTTRNQSVTFGWSATVSGGIDPSGVNVYNWTNDWSGMGGNNLTYSGTFTAPGTYKATFEVVRTSSGGRHEERTCFEEVTVTAPPPPQITSFQPTPASQVSGGTISLSWAASNATACTASGDSPWTGSKSTSSGNEAIPVLKTSGQQSYTLTCTGEGDPPAVRTVTVNVIPPPRCNDDIDNDGDGKVDWDGGGLVNGPDPGCTLGATDDDETDAPPPNCVYTYVWTPDPCTSGNQTVVSYTSNPPTGCVGTPLTQRACPTSNPFPGNPQGPGTFTNPLKSNSIYEFLAMALKALVELLIPIIVLFYVISGLMFITARGNPAKLSLAKMSFLYTTIGAAVVLGAWALAEVISNTVSQVTG